MILFQISGSLIEYAVILFRKQKVSKYGIPSQSVYSDKASAAAAIAAATSSAAAGAFTLATGLAQLGTTSGFKSSNRLSARPNNPSAPTHNQQQHSNDEMYDMCSCVMRKILENPTRYQCK